MRNMSFALTTAQLVTGRKTVTRRMGWGDLKPGERVRAVAKAMGLARGEHVHPLGEIEILSIRRERLDDVTAEECRREGFPEMSPPAFVAMLARAYACPPDALVTRIEFRLLACAGGAAV